MCVLVGRTAATIAVSLCLALVALVAAPVDVIAGGCPPKPWTLADIASVPTLWGEVSWPPETVRRVGCFGRARISFVARGGTLAAVFPGVVIPGEFGRTIYLRSQSANASEGWDLNAWVPLDSDAFDATNPDHEVWWRGSGHFDDPAAAGCRPDDGTSMIDDTPLVLSPAEAVEFCRNEFVIDHLEVLPGPPTDTLAGTAPIESDAPVIVILGMVGLIALMATLRRPARARPR